MDNTFFNDLKSELIWLENSIKLHYGTGYISTSATIKRATQIKKKLEKIEQRKNKILSLINAR